MLFYSTLIQSLSILFLWFVDIIPFFGLNNLNTFIKDFPKIFTCNFTNECGNAHIFFLLFNIGYVLTYISCAYFNIKSAPFSLMFSVLITPICVIFWLAFSSLNPNPQDIPLYYPLISILLGTIGMAIWKYWETKEEKLKEEEKLNKRISNLDERVSDLE